MTVRPLRLPDTVAQAGYDNLDPITQWFLGGSGTAGAEATGINDDSRYGLDLLNVGSGGLSLRATSGNGLHQIRVNNSGAAVVGGLAVTGGAFVAAGITSTNGFVVTTGATSLGGSLTVTGPATFVTGVSVGGALTVTGAATFSTGVAIGGGLSVTGPASFPGGVAGATTFAGAITVSGAALFQSSLEADSLEINGSASIDVNLSVDGSLDVDGNLDIDGDSDLQLVRLTPDPTANPQILFRATATRTYWGLGASDSAAPNFQLFTLDGSLVATEQFEITETGRVNAKSMEVYAGDLIVSAGDVNVTGGNVEISNGDLVVTGAGLITCDSHIEGDNITSNGFFRFMANYDLGDGIPTSTNNSDGHVAVSVGGNVRYIPIFNST